MNDQKNEEPKDASKERDIARPELSPKEWIEKVLNDPITEKESSPNKTPEDISGIQNEGDKKTKNTEKKKYEDTISEVNSNGSIPKNKRPPGKYLDQPEAHANPIISDKTIINQKEREKEKGPSKTIISNWPIWVFSVLFLLIIFSYQATPKRPKENKITISEVEEDSNTLTKFYSYKICNKGPGITSKAINNEKSFSGSIENKQGLTMFLSRSGIKLNGNYIDINTMKRKELSGYIQSELNMESVCLNEYLDGKATGVFIGNLLSSGDFEGMWIAYDNSEKYPFKLTEISK